MSTSSVPSRPGAIVRAVALTTLVVAVLDGLYVVAVFDWIMGATTATRIFQGIALALVGPEAALAGGAATVLLGIVMHVGVAFAWTLVWAMLLAASPRLRRLTASPAGAVLAGALYGAAVHLAMQLAVLPLTQARVAPLGSRSGLLVLLAHLTVVGPPIALLLRRR